MSFVPTVESVQAKMDRGGALFASDEMQVVLVALGAAQEREFAEHGMVERWSLRAEAAEAERDTLREVVAGWDSISKLASVARALDSDPGAGANEARDLRIATRAVLAAGTGDGEQSSSEAPETVARSGGERECLATWSDEGDRLALLYVYRNGKIAPGGSVRQLTEPCQAIFDYGADGDVLGVEIIATYPLADTAAPGEQR